jgi:K+-sensing histidine kinase KdpD
LPSDHRHVFEKFVQGESVTTRVHDEGGVGLGLFIVRTLVEDMGGTVKAETWESGGARFIVSLRPAEVGKPKSPLGSAIRSIRRPKAATYTHAGGVRSD